MNPRSNPRAISTKVKKIITRSLENKESILNIAKESPVSKLDLKQVNNVDQALLRYLKAMRDRRAPLTISMLKEKANCFASHFNILNFKCTRKWIYHFIARHNIVLDRIDGDPIYSATKEWLKNVWPNIRSKFSDDQIFNADETGFFYKLKPNKTLKLYGERCSGGEVSEERFTAMVATNLSGTIKKDLLIIGRSPRSFDMESLPAYEENCNAWMTAEIFEKWIRDWDCELVKTNKKILLLVDNCLAHPNVTDLKSITLIILPLSTPSALQPMNQGIIQALKYNFRKNLTLKFNESLAINPGSPLAEIKIEEAMLMLHDAWDKISHKTIYSAYKRAGYVDNKIAFHVFRHYDKPSVNDEPFSLWVNNLIISLLVAPKTWEKYVDVDSALVTSKELTDEIIVLNIVDDLRENYKEKQVEKTLNSCLNPVFRREDYTSGIISENLADIKHELDIKEEELDEELLDSKTTDQPFLEQNLDKESHKSDVNVEIKEESIPNAADALQAAELLSRFIHSNIDDDNIKMAMSFVYSCVKDYIL